MGKRVLIEKIESGEISKEELERIEEYFFKENPFEIFVSSASDRGIVYTSPIFKRLLEIKNENLDNLRISRYGDIEVNIYVKVKEDHNLKHNQLRFNLFDAVKLFYEEEIGKEEHLRLVFGENNKVFKDLLLINNNMMDNVHSLLLEGYNFSTLPEEKKREFVNKIDTELEPLVNILYRSYPPKNEYLRKRVEEFFDDVSYITFDLMTVYMPKGIPNIRVFKGLKENEIAVHPVHQIPYTLKEAEVCIVHPLLGENFFERMKVTTRSSLKLYQAGFSKAYLKSVGIPVEGREIWLSYSINPLSAEEEVDPQDMEFKI